MVVIREILQCEPGKIGDLKRKFQALNAVVQKRGGVPFRMLTDLAGQNFWTLVIEMEAEGLDAFFAIEEQVMADKEAQQVMEGYHDLVVSGRREVLKKVS